MFCIEKNSFVFVASDSLLGSGNIISSEPLLAAVATSHKKFPLHLAACCSCKRFIFLQIYFLQQFYCSQDEAEILRLDNLFFYWLFCFKIKSCFAWLNIIWKNSFVFVASDSLLGSGNIVSSEPLLGFHITSSYF